MPEPYVSATFDAVLMPVTKQVVAQFRLPKTASGAVVVSVEPGGVADLYGIEPGEVITSFGAKKFRRPADLDAMVLKSLQDGNSYFYFEGLRKGREKRTILYLEEEEYRRPIAVHTIPRWRSYNAPSFSFVRWYEPYSYYIVDIWDYSVYYIDQVIVSDVFVTSYYSEETYFYYDYTEISSLEVRESWVEEESVAYCGDVAGYECGLEEVGYPVEQEFESCTGEAGDDWCLPPDEVDADYCSSFPSDPSCGGDPAADDYCTYNPQDPDCGGAELAYDETGEDPAAGEAYAPAEEGEVDEDGLTEEEGDATGDDGDASGEDSGFDDGYSLPQDADADDGYVPEDNMAGDDGYASDEDAGSDEGYSLPQDEGADDGYVPEDGMADDDGYASEEDAGSDDGYSLPEDAGADDGYVPEDGMAGDDGYASEEDAGFDDGYALPEDEGADDGYVPDEGDAVDEGYAPDGDGEGGGDCYFDEDGIEIC